MSAANRTRGHNAERAVVKYLKANGFPDACTTRAKLGHDGATAPGDIDFHPLACLEVKDVAGSSWPSWCRQAAAEARPGMVPMVVRRTRGVPDVGLWECRVQRHAWTRITDWAPIEPVTNTVAVVADFGPHVSEQWNAYPLAAVAAAITRLDAP